MRPIVYGGVKTQDHCEERSDVAIRTLSNAQHCTGREAGHPPGRDCAPAGARNPCGLRGNGLPRPLRGLAMTDLGVRCVSIEHAKAPGSVRRGRDPRPTVRISALHPSQGTRPSTMHL